MICKNVQDLLTKRNMFDYKNLKPVFRFYLYALQLNLHLKQLEKINKPLTLKILLNRLRDKVLHEGLF